MNTADTTHRIYVEWEGGYFLTSLLNSSFHEHLQEMVADLGEPTKVEFRASDECFVSSETDE